MQWILIRLSVSLTTEVTARELYYHKEQAVILSPNSEMHKMFINITWCMTFYYNVFGVTNCYDSHADTVYFSLVAVHAF
jgi:hypothetical protein